MLELLAGFITELRNAGLPVSLTENLDAMHAISHIPLEDREAFKYALGATLVKNNAHWRSFETVFEVYFSLRGPEYSISDGEGSIEDFLQQQPLIKFPYFTGGEVDEQAIKAFVEQINQLTFNP